MKRRLPLFVAAVAGAVVTWVTPAGADPKNGFPITLDCGAAGSPTLVVFSNAEPSPGLDVASNSVFVPSSVTFTGTFYPAGGGEPETFTETWAKKGRQNGIDKLSCTFGFEETDEFGRFVGEGDVTGFMTPARR